MVRRLPSTWRNKSGETPLGGGGGGGKGGGTLVPKVEPLSFLPVSSTSKKHSSPRWVRVHSPVATTRPPLAVSLKSTAHLIHVKL